MNYCMDNQATKLVQYFLIAKNGFLSKVRLIVVVKIAMFAETDASTMGLFSIFDS